MPNVSFPWDPASLRKLVEYPQYFRGSVLSSNISLRWSAARVCSDVAIPGEEYPNEEMFTLKEILSEMEGKNNSKRVGIVSLDIVPEFLIKPIYEVCEGKEIFNSSNIRKAAVY